MAWRLIKDGPDLILGPPLQALVVLFLLGVEDGVVRELDLAL